MSSKVGNVSSPFGHTAEQLAFWRKLAKQLVGKQSTPFYLFSVEPVQAALTELQTNFGHLPIRHWLSFKTQPLRPLVQWWKEQGRGIEVVSEFELRAALHEGFAPENILVNGPAKYWLLQQRAKGLRVNFDSAAEAKAVLPHARKLKWRLGLRINTSEEYDPEKPKFPTQFGFTPEEAVAWLKKNKSAVETVHFHLRTNIRSAISYERALNDVANVCTAANWQPTFVDCGGGFPAPHILTRGGEAVNGEFKFADVAKLYERTLKKFVNAKELWLENGRWLTARSGVFVMRVLEVKERRGIRQLICNGGRTMNALLSLWEQHEIVPLQQKTGPKVLTTVVGPTCMAFDQVARRPFAKAVKAGDHLLWLDAGAYHLPWETRFSHGLAPVYWHDGKRVIVARNRESFESWWGTTRTDPL